MLSQIFKNSDDIGYLGLKKWIALKAASELLKERIHKHPLWMLAWECTLRCNLHCRHCGSDCRAQVVQPDMPAEDFFRVLDSIAPIIDPDMFRVALAGGEVLLRNDLREIGAGIQKRGYPWTFVTNGLLLNDDKLAELCEVGLSAVALSLDGPEEIHNDRKRQHPCQSEHLCIRGEDGINCNRPYPHSQ